MKNTVSWEKYHSDIDKLIGKLAEYNPDIIIPCRMGGLIPAAIIAKRLEKRFESHTQPADVRPISILRRGEKRWLDYDFQGDIKGKKLLVVEDDSFTGLGLKFAKKEFRERRATVKTAAVYVTPEASKNIDFWVETTNQIPDYPWKKSYGGDKHR